MNIADIILSIILIKTVFKILLKKRGKQCERCSYCDFCRKQSKQILVK